MSTEADTIFRCVCGADLPLPSRGEVRCPECGRRHRPWAMGKAHLETVVLAQGGKKPAHRDRAEGVLGTAEVPSLLGQALDHFKVIRELGRGGVGTVYLALDTSLERYVALKVLNREADGEALRSFVHEARAQARINHPGITTIYYVGRQGAIPYFAMEYVPGQDLAERLDTGPIPPGEVIRIALAAVAALREANSQGITHRDIKPGNLLLSSAGSIKLTDFGLSKMERGDLRSTDGHSITGTPSYIAPEQARGGETDFRTDMYSLGATLYHLAYGRPPFEGTRALEVMKRHMYEELRFPDLRPADLPPGFEAVIARMMAKDPRKRYASYDDLERALFGLLPEAQVVPSILRRAIAMSLEIAGLVVLSALAEGLFDLVQYAAGRETGGIDVVPFASLSILMALLGFQVFRGRTPGKDFARIRISRIPPGRLRKSVLAARWLIQWLPVCVLNAVPLVTRDPAHANLMVLLVLALWTVDNGWVLTNRRRRAIHDLVLRTWVLEERLFLGFPARRTPPL